ncbi:major facilitator superfamily domain-containing protein [Phycomyces blakesleeanus]
MSQPTQKTPLLDKKPPLSRPTNQRRRSSFDPSTYNSTGQAMGYVRSLDLDVTLPGLSLKEILALTVCMGGAQFTCKWSVELAYGTPYLLSLDLSKELTALVWLAGPLSGLLVQPLVGAFSDKCTSRYGKRRPFIVAAGFLTCMSMLGVAYAREIGAFAGRYLANEQVPSEAVAAVSSFYFLDFTLNAVQAVCRALILDIPPLWQQEYANAWSARMSNGAMVLGYFVGYIDLVHYAPWMGDTQIKAFCIVAIAVFCGTLTITCLSVEEKVLERVEDDDLPWYHTLAYIWRAFRFLPRPIQTLCNTQFFAWMGWFPFLFYSTQWVSDIYFANNPPIEGQEQDWTEGTRAGSFALLCYSLVSVGAGIVLPALLSYFNKIAWLSLLNIYTVSHLTVAVALLSALWVRSVMGATIVLAIMGIPWAIVLWVPFSLVGEYVSFEDEKRSRTQQLPSTSSIQRLEDQQDEFDAGMILGVHNMYIVFPQFAVAIISSVIFAAAAPGENQDDDAPMSSVTSVLVFGGLMALVAALLSRLIIRVK